MLALILFIVLILFFIILIEIVSRKYSISSSVSRKLSHISGALAVSVMPIFLSRSEVIIVGMFFAMLLFSTRRTNIFSSIHSVQRRTFGEIFLPLGVVSCALLFLPENKMAFQFGILIMGISDALASLIGERFGKHIIRIFGQKKTIEGSVAFFISSIIIACFFVPGLEYRVLIISFILTIVELLSIAGLDNLILPIVGAYLIQLLK